MVSDPILPEKYKFEVSASKKAQFKVVKDLLTKADTIPPIVVEKGQISRGRS